MLITAGLSGLMARRTLLLGITAWQAHSVTMPAVAAQRGAEDAYAVSEQPSTDTHHIPTSTEPAKSNLERAPTSPAPALTAATVRRHLCLRQAYAARGLRRAGQGRQASSAGAASAERRGARTNAGSDHSPGS